MGIDPDYQTLSDNLGVSVKSVALMDERLSGGPQEFSLDAPVGEDDSKALGDYIGSTAPGVDEELAHLEELDILKKHLGGFLETLKDNRDREIFKNVLWMNYPHLSRRLRMNMVYHVSEFAR